MRQQGYLNLSPRTQRIAFNGLLGTLALVLSACSDLIIAVFIVHVLHT